MLTLLLVQSVADNPMNAKFLTNEEKVIAIERVRSNQNGIENKHWKMEQCKEALLDWKVSFLFKKQGKQFN